MLLKYMHAAAQRPSLLTKRQNNDRSHSTSLKSAYKFLEIFVL